MQTQACYCSTGRPSLHRTAALYGWLGYRLAEMAQFKVTQILKVSWFWIDLAVPVGALATAIYTLYWLINDTKQSDSGDKMQ